jgi:hypothetical protein
MAMRSAVLGILMSMVGSAALAGDRPVNGGELSGRFQAPRAVWAGEAFVLSLTWEVDWQAFRNLQGALQWQPKPLIVEPWSAPTLAEVKQASGHERARLYLKTRALALKAGAITLEPARQGMTIETGMERSGDYERVVTRDLSVQTAPATVLVKPLPPAPAEFSGAVGHFALQSWIDSQHPSVGQPIAWNIALSGVGNWPYVGLPARLISDDFDVVSAPRVEESTDTMLFERRIQEKVLLVPKRAGHFELRPVHMVVFDPDGGRYVWLNAPAISLEVSAAAGHSGPGGAADVVLDPASSDAQAADDAALTLPLPTRRGDADRPLERDAWRRAWLTPLIAFAVAAAIVASAIALAQYRVRNPRHRWKRAYRRSGAALRRLARTADGAERHALLRAWQKNVAIVCNLRIAAPVPASFGHPDWARLWAECDVFLYGRSNMLSRDWIERAQRLLRERRAAMRDKRGTRATALLCLIAAGLAYVTFTPAQPAAAPGQPAAADLDPLDWVARARTAQRYASHGHWDAAAGEAAIAWIQHPNSSVTRRLWLRAAQQAGYALDTHGGVPRPLGWRRSLAGLMSLSQWQHATLIVEWMAAVCMGILLLRHRCVSKHGARLAAGVLGLCLLGAAAGISSLQVFSGAQGSETVIIWRAAELRALPVEAPAGASAAASLLPPGMMARVDRRFLDWRRVTLTDGRAGWLRRRDLYWLWQREATYE